MFLFMNWISFNAFKRCKQAALELFDDFGWNHALGDTLEHGLMEDVSVTPPICSQFLSTEAVLCLGKLILTSEQWTASSSKEQEGGE